MRLVNLMTIYERPRLAERLQQGCADCAETYPKLGMAKELSHMKPTLQDQNGEPKVNLVIV
jgi:hypothetical protein